MKWFRWLDENGILRFRSYNPDHAVGGKHYRKMPVANTRCFRGGGGIFRYPQTQQELREIDKYYHDEDMKFYKVKHRAKRNRTPTCWDDELRSDFKIKNKGVLEILSMKKFFQEFYFDDEEYFCKLKQHKYIFRRF